MDRNTILGTVLIGALIIGYLFFNAPSEQQVAQQKRYLDSIARVDSIRYAEQILEKQQAQTAEIEKEEAIAVLPDSVKEQVLHAEYGRYSAASTGNEEFTTIGNGLIDVTFSNKGGKLYSVNLKKYKTYKQKNEGIDGTVQLLGEGTKFGIALSEIGKSTDQLFYTKVEAPILKTGSDSIQEIAYRLYAAEDAYIEYVYNLAPNSYKVDLLVNMVNMGKYIKESRYTLQWDATTHLLEKDKKGEDIYTNIQWKYYQDEIDYTSPRTSKEEKEELAGRVKWIAFKQHFFTTALIAKDSFEKDGTVESIPAVDNDTILKEYKAQLFLPKTDATEMSFYLGPNHYPTLKKQNVELEGILDLGWFGFITKFAIIPIFNWLSSFIVNYGIIILLLTLIIKAALFPLTFKSYLSTARMRVLKPQTEALNAKYPDKKDSMKRQQESMALYRKAGVNPMGGCIPMLIQFPFLLAMFRFFPASIELRQQSFLWADDLSSYDAIVSWTTDVPLLSSIYGNHISLFTLLMAVSMIFVNKINSSSMNTTPGMPNMKVMMMLMSVMMVFWFNNYSSGLSFYYLLANTITITQTLVIRRMINDDDILSKLQANQKKPKKKSKFAQRLEDMQKQQQQIRKK